MRIFDAECAFGSKSEGEYLILVVEDDPQVGRLIALVLQRNGHESEVLADGEAAFERARAVLPQMIFADLAIKGMGGEALCVALKRDPETKNIPFVIVSGDRDIAEKAKVCGADDFMGKPFEFVDLVRVVTRYARTDS